VKESLLQVVIQRKLQLSGHIGRMKDDRMIDDDDDDDDYDETSSHSSAPSHIKTALFSCQGLLSRFMYLRPHCLKNAPGPPQILPQIQDGGQKSNMAAKKA